MDHGFHACGRLGLYSLSTLADGDPFGGNPPGRRECGPGQPSNFEGQPIWRLVKCNVGPKWDCRCGMALGQNLVKPYRLRPPQPLAKTMH